ncbi:hypothetical protein N7462_008448 [Penicillium macrosclerotiorum]|uniref:uncharacterized protein n=1 Tax=Penicillium macrosclerotiorum TaxID=303699 RepID=UPI002546F83E|nr:uncharacterized protein N7462_008448 [Penicillium macrosclerotiorum]KAJ5675551.1 hypothetical protein N7462_008448 [Penicillium macrosclerotiorum]
MDLPRVPTFSFTIPSVHDERHLECRLYVPHKTIESTSSWATRGAIVAHPYAPLGGCFDDPIVSFIGGELLQAGYVVGTFNFRGAGNSDGRTSWTAKPELGDYVSFYGFMLHYLHALNTAFTSKRTVASDGELGSEAVVGSDNRVQLVLGGYSFGSLIASHVPDLDVMVDLFGTGTASSTSPIYAIGNEARKFAARSMRHVQPSRADGRADDLKFPRGATAISYLLVSPLLPPVSQLLTLFTALTVTVQGQTSDQARPAGRPADQLSAHRTLALYGDQDTFTSARKLQRWSAELAHLPQSQFRGCQIDGAGHFWREKGVETRARQALLEWLQMGSS